MACLIALGLFVLPVLLVQGADQWIPSASRTVLLTLVPVFAVVLEPHLGGEPVRPIGRNSFLAALLAMAGAFCVFPIRFPETVDSTLAVCAVILAAVLIAAANCKAVALIQSEPDAFPAIVTIITTIAAILLAALSAVYERPTLQHSIGLNELAWTALLELPALLLLFWLMNRMTASRMATRYLLAPLLAVMLGAAFLRANLTLRTWIGLVLMAAGAGFLLFDHRDAPTPTGLSLR